MRLWPKSLAAQLLAWLLCVLVLAQVVTLLVYLDERKTVVRAAGHTEVLSRTATLVRLLITTPTEFHNRIVRTASGPRLRFWLSKDNSLSAGDHPRLHEALTRLLGDAAQSVVVNVREAGDRPFRRLRKAWRAERDGATVPQRPRPRGKRPKRRFLDLSMAVQVNTGQWLNVETLIPPPAPRFAITSILLFVAVTIAIVLIVIVVVRRATRPLGELAQAAHRFGRGEAVEPLLERGPEDVASAIRAFNQMREQLTAFVHARTQMLAAVAHDLRSPLTSLRLRAEMVSDDNTRDRMVASLDEMQQMIEASLNFLRADAAEEASREVDLGGLVQTVAEEFRDQRLPIVVSVEERLVCDGKPLALRRALRNIIDNALKYGIRATVTVTRASGFACVNVCDEGPGIPLEDVERVIMPFVRLEDSRSRDTGGIGMGLAIATSVAHAHGGSLTLSNRDEGGLCAELRLPLS